jgi:transcription antitermination factor NusG
MHYQIGQIVGYVERPAKFCTVDGDWFVVNTESRQEELAKGEIAQSGLVTYLPMAVRMEKHGRGGLRLVARPVFPSYLFVRCPMTDDVWNRLTTTRGVRGLLGCDMKPKPINIGEVEVIRLYETECADKERKRLDKEQAAARARAGGKSGIVWDFAPGDRVRITNGPFASFFAQLQTAVDDHDRIRALMDIFGSVTPMQLSAFDIESLDSAL